MRQSIDDIIASEVRINWSHEVRLIELYKYGHSEGIISHVKYDYWDRVQKLQMKVSYVNFNYESLKDHPEFVTERKHFKWNQTV